MSLRRLPTILAGVILAGCAGTNTPYGWLPSADEARTDVWGGWVEVWADANGDRLARGELLAISMDTIYVAETDWDRLEPGAAFSGQPLPFRVRAVSQKQAGRVIVRGYSGGQHTATNLSALFTVSVFTHGWYALISLPVWLSTTFVMYRDETQGENTYRTPKRAKSIFDESVSDPEAEERWRGLRRWARYPQGLPHDIDRDTIHPYLHRYPTGFVDPDSLDIPGRGRDFR
ncbi:MAG: hypothetical protein KC729_04800 [Candidatus Eisenbacteria bacterium]|uniref:Lipoprotein n=1 Tax=Eiseniibacteriota bacterium TaxID=2212470 RepID=A0A956LZ99_UNCEI|nr:hypothetical protein [Candidatus Eisenbacteria bacterium]